MKKIFLLLILIFITTGCISQNNNLEPKIKNDITPILLNCAKEGENFSAVYKKDKYPEHCCSGLKEWQSGMDTRISIADKCYETMLVSGNPVGTCLNCGNGICEDIEDVCNCKEDCNAENSKYISIEYFCNYYDCDNRSKNLPICNLCK